MSARPGLIWLQAGGPGGEPVGFFESPMFPLLLIMFIWMYFLIWRPQQKQRREQEAMLKSIEKGDSVVTAGGVHGRVTGLTDDVLTLEIGVVKGERVRIKVDRPRIDRVEKAKKGGES